MELATTYGMWQNSLCTARMGFVCEYGRKGFTAYTEPTQSTPSSHSCPDGWSYYDTNNNCYKAFYVPKDERLIWSESRKYCTDLGGDLATMATQQEEAFIVENEIDKIQIYGITFWIGLFRSGSGGWLWADDTPLSYTNWAENEPNNFNDRENCVEFYKNTHDWNDLSCDLGRNWVCKVGAGVPLQTTPPPTTINPLDISHCGDDDDWLFYNDFCYYFQTSLSGKYWNSARDFCLNNGGDLASILGSEEMSFIETVIGSQYGSSMWIGMNKGLNPTDAMTWVDGSVYNYHHWNTHQPDDQEGTRECAAVSQHVGVWALETCETSLGYICKKENGSKTDPTTTSFPSTVGYCPSGWQTWRDKCFFVIGEDDGDRTDWFSAKDTCTNMNGELAEVRSSQEQDYLTSLLWQPKASVWIGLRYNYWNYDFEWESGMSVGYVNWDQDQPNSWWSNDCVEMKHEEHRAGKWVDGSCYSYKAFICQRYRDTSLLTPAPTDSPCNIVNALAHADNCYIPYTSDNTWKSFQAADNICQFRHAGYLASITDVYEESFLKDQITTWPVPEMWVGLRTTSEHFGTFTKWTDSWPVFYTNWGPNQPDLTSTDNMCVKMMSNGAWQMESCSKEIPFLCKVSTRVPPLPPSHIDSPCPDSLWLDGGDSCYRVIEDVFTW